VRSGVGSDVKVGSTPGVSVAVGSGVAVAEGTGVDEADAVGSVVGEGGTAVLVASRVGWGVVISGVACPQPTTLTTSKSRSAKIRAIM
jgi:hypothetical protein